MQHLELSRVRDFGDVISDTFTYIRLHYLSLGKALLLIAFPIYLIAGYLVGSSYSSLMSGILNEVGAEPDIGSLGWSFVIGFILLLLASVSIQVITLKHISLVSEDRTPEFAGILENFGTNFFLVLIYYIILVVVIPFAFMIFILPGIYLFFKICMVPIAMIIDKKGVDAAFKRSWNLTGGYWWQTAGLYIVMNIITSFMSYAISTPFMILVTFISASGADTSGAFLGGSLGIFYGLMIVLSSLFSVVILIALALHYYNLVERKEGISLKSQIEELRN
ncbi:hypothetical protein AB2B38_004115 [Balneola sp. MJW-20]|uniref:hypothetical protein n=1 Tax=Gracilimonas aurantiaca TaxID=3234185 RepID=UPI0034650B68